MRAQRPPHLSSAVNAVAESLPFPDRHFDASMATYTVHQWSNLDAGLREMLRVTRDTIVILTCDPNEVERFWLSSYAPSVLATEARRYPLIEKVTSILGAKTRVSCVPIPLLCKDGFNEAYYGRPECYLDDRACCACSAWSFVDAAVCASYVEHLRKDLATGGWDRQFGHLRSQEEYDGSLRLIVFTR